MGHPRQPHRSRREEPVSVGEDGDDPMTDPSQQTDPSGPDGGRPVAQRSKLSPVHRAAIEDYLEALVGESTEQCTALRERHPRLASEFDAVDSAWRRLSSRLPKSRDVSRYASVDPGISLDRGPGGVPRAAGSPSDSDLLQRIAERSAPPARYSARREIARGGMGSIQRVWDEDLRRYLVMKIMLRPQDRDPHAKSVPPDSRQLTRFLEEAQITGQLDHPAIVPVHDLGLDEEGRLYFTMPLVKGRDLSQVIELARRGEEGWTRNRVLDVLVRVMEATAFAHDRGVVHRDLKPENIMVGRFGETYVMDWGLARVLDELERQRSDSGVSVARNLKRRVKRSGFGRRRVDADSIQHRGSFETLDGDMVGTPGYMAPEQARGERDLIGPRSDIYSIGSIIYQLLTGYRPFDDPISRSSNRPLLERILDGRPVPIKKLENDQPEELIAIAEKAMADDPMDRYDTVIEMVEDVRAFIEGHVVQAYETGLLAEVRKWVVRNRLLASISATAVLAVFGSLLLLVVQAQNNLRAIRGEQEQTEEQRRVAEEQRGKAEAEALLAEERLAEADQLRKEAEAAQRDQEELNLLLESQKREAEEKTAIALSLEQDARRNAYIGNVAAAAIALRSNELIEARRLLDACDRDLRRWEWDHLSSRLDTSLTRSENTSREPVDVAFMTDDRAAVLDGDGNLRVLELATGEAVQTWMLDSGDARDLIYDADRDHLWVSSDSARIRRFDVDRPDAPLDIGTEFVSDSGSFEWGPLTLSPDGRRIAAGVVDSGNAAGNLRVVVFDARSGARVAVLESGERRAVTALSWSPDGTMIAAGTESGDVQIWNAGTSDLLSVLRPLESSVSALTFGEDSSRLAIAGGSDEAEVLDVATGAVLQSLRGHQASIVDLAFAPFDRYLVTASLDRSLAIWDVDTGTRLGQLRGHSDALVAVDLSATGDRVLSLASDRSLRTWDPMAPESVVTLSMRETTRADWLTVTRDERYVVVPVGEGAEVFDLRTLGSTALLGDDRTRLGRLHEDRSTDRLLVSSGDGVGLFDLKSSELTEVIEELPLQLGGDALSSDGRRFVVLTTSPEAQRRLDPGGSNDRQTLLFFELDAGALRPGPLPWGACAAYVPPSGQVLTELEFVPGTHDLAVATTNGTMLLLDGGAYGRVEPRSRAASITRVIEQSAAVQLRTMWHLLTPFYGGSGALPRSTSRSVVMPATALTVAPGRPSDDPLIAVGFADGSIELWSPGSEADGRTLRSNSTAIRALAFDPRGERLVSGAADGSVRVFEPESGEQVLRLTGGTTPIRAVTFSPSGDDLLTLDALGNLRLWASASLEPLFEARRLAEQRRREARNFLVARINPFVTLTDLMSQLSSERDLDPELRANVQTFVRLMGDDPVRLNRDAWDVVRSPDHTDEEYRDAYPWALIAQAIQPDDPIYRRTLGIAHFRLGRYQSAIEALETSSRSHPSGPRAEELAVLAMSYSALGQFPAADERRYELEQLMSTGAALRDEVARSFQREVRSILGPPGSRTITED